MQNTQLLLIKSKRTIQQLRQQLQKSINQNQSQAKIITLLTQQKQFYMNKYYHQQSQLLKLNQDIDKKNILISLINQQNQKFKKDIILIQDQLKQKNFLLNAQDKLMERMKQEKRLIQKEWNRVVRSVKGKLCDLQMKKLNQFVNNKDINYQQDKTKYQDKQKKRCISQQKSSLLNQNNLNKPLMDIININNINFLSHKNKQNKTRMNKVNNIIKQINFKIAHDQIESLLNLKNKKIEDIKNIDAKKKKILIVKNKNMNNINYSQEEEDSLKDSNKENKPYLENINNIEKFDESYDKKETQNQSYLDIDFERLTFNDLDLNINFK